MTATRTQVSRSGRIAAWAVLAGAGSITMVYNIWHATHAGHMLAGLALLYGFGPVFIAALLSHIVAEYDGGWFLKTVVFAAMIGAMSMSIGATAEVVGQTGGPILRWVFGAVLDTAALVALRVILDGRKRDSEAADALTAAEARARQEAGKSASIVMELEEARAACERAEADRAEAQAKAEVLARKLDSATARKRTPATARKAARKPAPATARKRPEVTGPEAADATADLDSEALVLRYLSEGHSASEAGRLAGLSDARGRQIARKLAKVAPADAVDGNQASG